MRQHRILIEIEMLSQTSTVALVCLMFRCIACAQSPDAQVERFILENDYLLLKGVYPSKQTDESRAVTRKLQLLPSEAIDSGLRLLIKGSEEHKGYRPQVVAFLEGMYRTHPVSDEKHRQVARVVFNEMIQPRGKHFDFGDMLSALHFFDKYGTREDMVMLAPLLNHSDQEVKRRANLLLHAMARDRGLPDPTVERSNVPATPVAPPVLVENGQANKSVPKGTPAPTPVRTVTNANAQTKWNIALGALAVVLAVVWIAIRRPKSRKP